MDLMDKILIVITIIAILAVLMGVCLWILDMTHRWGAPSEAKLWKQYEKEKLSKQQEQEKTEQP